MRGEKEKSIEEKKIALVAKVFCAHAYSTDLIGSFEHICSSNKPRRKKDNVSFQSTNKKSMVNSFVLTKFFKNLLSKNIAKYCSVKFGPGSSLKLTKFGA